MKIGLQGIIAMTLFRIKASVVVGIVAGILAGNGVPFIGEASALPASQTAATSTTPSRFSGRALFCAFGASTGMAPLQTPGSFERWHAVMVVEFQSPNEVSNIAVSEFALIDQNGAPWPQARIVSVGEFVKTRAPDEGDFAYYLNAGGTQAWGGTLPAGTIRLYVRIALVNERPDVPRTRCRMVLGGETIEGPLNGAWPG